MFVKNRSYTLAGKTHYHANFAVNPTGTLSVEIVEDHEHLEGEFQDLCFRQHGKTTDLDCFEHCEPKHCCWHLELSPTDAKELTQLIDDAKDEYEILMRDL